LQGWINPSADYLYRIFCNHSLGQEAAKNKPAVDCTVVTLPSEQHETDGEMRELILPCDRWLWQELGVDHAALCCI